MHGHFAGIEVDAQHLGRFHQFLERRDIVFAHQMTEDFRTRTEEVESACRRDFQSTHHETESLCQPVSARKGATLFLLDGIQPPECEEDVHLISHGGCSSSQCEYSCEFVEIATEGDDG